MNMSVVPVDVAYSGQLTRSVCDALSETYQGIKCKAEGKSISGQTIPVLSIGEGEKEVFFAASFHANEWITTPLVLKFAEDCARAIKDNTEISGRRAAELFHAVRLFILPMVNPDGVDLVNGFLQGVLRENASYIAEQYPNVPFPEGWKANLLGTDLNLNFPAGWRLARRMKFAAGFTTPAPRDFVGFAPLSAPEARVVYDFTLRRDFSMILAFHTQGNIIYWKYDDYEPPMSRHIAQILSEASGYPLELTPAFSSQAGYKDWFIKNYDRPGYTVECGIGKNPLPIRDFWNIYRAVLPLMAAALDSAAKLL